MHTKPSSSDWYIIGLFFLIAIPVTFSGYDYATELNEAILDTIVYTVFTFVVSYIIVYIFFPRYFPDRQILRLFFYTLLLMVVAGTLEIIGYQMADGNKQWYRLFRNYNFPFWAISSSAQNAGIMVGILLGKKFYDAQIEIQKREKEKKESELRLLKSQVDPHFLFNNLNTVDSLIDKDPKIAKQYINHLSQLYRYLIQTKDDEVVPLVEEIEFAKNYIFLIEKRFGSAYQFRLADYQDRDDMLIPPGAIQTALENVVKHNSAQAEQIVTDISIDKDYITIRNNIVEKEKRNPSTGTGLSNLMKRYSLLTDKEIKITKEEDFSIELPLIKMLT